jgi:hypothetical protein
MEGLDDALERLRRDAEFRNLVADDPRAALAGYDLTAEDLQVLAKHLDPDGLRPAGFAALFAMPPDDEDP